MRGFPAASILIGFAVAAASADSVPLATRAPSPPAARREPAGGGDQLLSGVGFTRFGFYNPVTGEALPGSTWTFDHGAADPFEGWTARTLAANAFTAFRLVNVGIWSDHNSTAPPPAPVLGGAASVWVGLFEDEATCASWAGTRGYGNSWNQRFYSPQFTNASGLMVNVSFDYFVDAEPGSDFLRVYVVDPDLGSPILVTSLTGQSGSPGSPTPFSQNVATGVGDFRLLFVFTSDGGWSDEDGFYTTAVGAAGIDNVTLTNVTPAGPWTFESDLEGWTAEPVPGTVFASVVANNFVIPDTACGLVSNVIGFYDLGDTTHPGSQQERFYSPPVPLGSDSLNIFAQMDLYAYLPSAQGVFYRWAFSYYPDTCSGAWSAPAGPAVLYYSTDSTCQSRRYFATDSLGAGILVPPTGVDSVRFIFSIVQTSGPGSGSFAPLLDNIWIGLSRAAVIHVPSPSYPTIQAGVDAAASGDTVLVAAGTYSGIGNCGIDFGGTDLALLSEDGPLATIVDCAEADRGLFFHSGETAAAVVDGFTFTGGDSTIGGSSIRVGPSASSPTIRNCVVKGNVAQYPDSGIVLLEAGSPTFTDCTFIANRGNPEIVLVTGGTPTFTDCFVIQNVGTGLVADPVSGTWTGCEFSSNTSGGIHLRGAVPGPAALRSDSCLVQPTFTGCRIAGNTTTASGGGILIDPVTFCVYMPQFLTCLVTGNSASGNGGGLAVLGTVWDGATAPYFGGCTFAGNNAGTFGGALYVGAYDAAGLGQGIVTVENAIVWDNCAGDLVSQAVVEADNQLLLSCSLADTTGALQGDGTITVTSVSALAPGFCESVRCADAPTVGGDFRLSEDSPALPGAAGNPCGTLLGAFDVGCPTATGVPSIAAPVPDHTMLHPCRPNPFRGTTEIRYDLARTGAVSVRIYDVTGRRVATIAEGPRAAAEHREEWDGRDGAGHVVASGVYFVRLVAEDRVETRRIVLLR